MTTFLALLILALSSDSEGGRVQTKEPPIVNTKRTDIEGIYLVTGSEKGVKYNGVSVIRQLDVSDSYHVVNVVGRVITQGIGLRSGDSLAISWSAGGMSHGVTVYRITGRTLTGRWSQLGQIHREELKFLGELPED